MTHMRNVTLRVPRHGDTFPPNPALLEEAISAAERRIKLEKAAGESPDADEIRAEAVASVVGQPMTVKPYQETTLEFEGKRLIWKSGPKNPYDSDYMEDAEYAEEHTIPVEQFNRVQYEVPQMRLILVGTDGTDEELTKFLAKYKIKLETMDPALRDKVKNLKATALKKKKAAKADDRGGK